MAIDPRTYEQMLMMRQIAEEKRVMELYNRYQPGQSGLDAFGRPRVTGAYLNDSNQTSYIPTTTKPNKVLLLCR